MKKSVLLLLIALSGCGRFNSDYQPQLSSRPSDTAKYEADRKACISSVGAAIKAQDDDYYRRAMSGNLTLAEKSSGLIPPAIQLATSTQDDTPMDIVDRCMAAKGYAVIPR